MTDIFVSFGSTFPVPTAVADHLLKLASHDQLKVLLYVLSRTGEALSASQIAAACGVSADAVEEALVWWQDANILGGTAPAPPTVRLTDSTAPAAAAAQAAPAPAAAAALPPSAAVQSDSSRFSVTPKELAQRLSDSAVLAEMFTAAEKVVGRLLNATEQKSLLWMHDYLGFSPEIILTLIAYCVRANVFQVRYMEKIAADWQERGVNTLALAEADIQRRIDSATYTGQIMKLFEMTRKPTEKQQSFIDGWQEMQCPLDMVRLAYEISRDRNDDKLVFPYIDRILRRWNAAGIHSADAARAEQEAHAAAYRAKKPAGSHSGSAASGGTQSSNSSIDMAEVEKLMNQF